MTYDNALLLTQQCKGQETVHMLQNVDVCANQHHQKNITHKKKIYLYIKSLEHFVLTVSVFIHSGQSSGAV